MMDLELFHDLVVICATCDTNTKWHKLRCKWLEMCPIVSFESEPRKIHSLLAQILLATDKI